ncbi:hypothetical protein [Winogradskyella helgolandensis]|uniref:hypothetical protein n=1 Tax=Winogradskyella helgolandensis TaxID=2697010 RepID=UPI0015CB0224|nr:hypothetical protein [Winogradskyella helgolandensis]
MDSKFDYSQSCWDKIRKIFDDKYNVPTIESVNEMKYAKYLDESSNEHIVSLFNSNQFNKSLYNRDLNELHSELNKLKTKKNSQIHIVCTGYICSHQYRGYYHAQVQLGIKYYYLDKKFVLGEDIPCITDITNLLKNYTDYSKLSRKNSSNDDYDPYSESNIMRDLMNGEGEKHGF